MPSLLRVFLSIETASNLPGDRGSCHLLASRLIPYSRRHQNSSWHVHFLRSAVDRSVVV